MHIDQNQATRSRRYLSQLALRFEAWLARWWSRPSGLGAERLLENVGGQVVSKVRPGLAGEVVIEPASSNRFVKEETAQMGEGSYQVEVEANFQVSRFPYLPRQPVQRQLLVSSSP